MKRSSSLRSLASLALWLFAILTFRSVAASAYVIPSGSMLPTLQVGDRIVVEKLSLGLNIPFIEHKLGARSPDRSDIVVFAHPITGIDLVKRVVAVAGDRVELVDGELRVNGQPAARRSLGAMRQADYSEKADSWTEGSYQGWEESAGGASYTTLSLQAKTSFGPVLVPAGAVFVLGDNRDNSSDSRYWGHLPISRIRGRARAVLWSAGPDGPRWGRFFSALR